MKNVILAIQILQFYFINKSHFLIWDGLLGNRLSRSRLRESWISSNDTFCSPRHRSYLSPLNITTFTKCSYICKVNWVFFLFRQWISKLLGIEPSDRNEFFMHIWPERVKFSTTKVNLKPKQEGFNLGSFFNAGSFFVL